MAIFSRFRSKERDIETDIERVLPIRDAAMAALRDAEKEHAGLQKRIADAGAGAAFLFGDGLESEADIDPANKARLEDVEGILVRGQIRNRYLERQIAALHEIKTMLDSIAKPETDPRAYGQDPAKLKS